MKIYIEHTDGKFYHRPSWNFSEDLDDYLYDAEAKTSIRNFEIGSRVYFQGRGWTEVKAEDDSGCDVCVLTDAVGCDGPSCVSGKVSVVFVKLETATTDKTPDPINHPAHYTSKNGVECIQVTELFNFNRGNAIKYIWRAGEKDPAKEVEDLEKAVWYIQREITRIKEARDD